MRMLSASELLGVWERGRVQGPIDQALLLLTAACPDTSTDDLARLSIGWRDHALLTLREWTFGRAITSITNCPQCGEQLELEFDAA
ncbi:MAG: phage baseplate protein, partial [Pseudomonadota bacterium]|nr:phage baseplate protein [Pseudomonadota bacterium]